MLFFPILLYRKESYMGVKCILTGQTIKPSSDDFNITEEGIFSIIKKITEV